MSDTIIINTISKIHSIIINFFVFIFLTLFIIFAILQNGLSIEKISVQNLKIEKLYIKWGEKLNVNINKIEITAQAKNTPPLNIKKMKQILGEFLLFNNWFETIKINQIQVNELFASLKYADKTNGFLVISSPNILFHALLFFDSDTLNFHIEEFHDFKRKIDIQGDIIFNSKKLTVLSALNININDNAKLILFTYATERKLFYTLKTVKNIEKIQHLINILELPKEVQYWVYDAIKMQNIALKKFYGWLEYNKLEEALQHLHASAIVNQLIYTYNPKLDAIHTLATELEFKNGILFIFPKKAYSYDAFLDKSYLQIDFNHAEELLSLFLKFQGSVDKNILKILNTYKINLPFLQNKGVVATNLKIDVNLRTIAVNAVGDFFTKEANFNYLGLDIDIFDAYISLNNFDVTIKEMLAKYQNIATAKVNVKLNVDKHQGTIKFQVQESKFKEIGLSLKTQPKPLIVNYKISPKQDIISVENSIWSFRDKELFINRLDIPCDLKNLTVELPTTLIEIPNILSASFSGNLSFAPTKVNLQIELFKFLYNNIELQQSNAQSEIVYENEELKIKSPNRLKLQINDTQTVMEDIAVNFKNKNLLLQHGILSIENLLTTNVEGEYNLESKNGVFNFQNLNIKNEDFNEIFSDNKPIQLLINSHDENTTLSISELFAEYILTKDSWKFKIDSLAKIAQKSKLLQDYNLTEGNFEISQQKNHDNINILANIKYPYKFVLNEDKEIENYMIQGKINTQNKEMNLTINDIIKIGIDDNITINAKNIGVNINEIFRFFNDANTTINQSKKIVSLKTQNCFLYITKNRRILSDSIDLQYANNRIDAQLFYHGAKANFELEKKQFHLHGKNFDDTFMQHLFALSKFKDGTFTFKIDGSTKEYDGIFLFNNITVLEYKILNNILAFVNTIPSLVTFSLPGYNTIGLPIKEGYLHFKAKDNLYNITDINFNSQELSIVGKGVVNLQANSIDLDLNLQTDLASNMSKIPAIGYIIFGENSISTSLSVTGSLSNPDVHSKLVQEIIVAPFNIIKRTFLFPLKLFDGK